MQFNYYVRIIESNSIIELPLNTKNQNEAIKKAEIQFGKLKSNNLYSIFCKPILN